MGCGDGRLLRYLNAIFNFEYCLGIDRKADNEQSGNLEFIRGDIDKIPAKNNAFDAVLMLAVIEHIEPFNLRAVLDEVRRILKKNGKLIITTPTPASKPVLEFLAFKLGIISKTEIADHKRYYDLAELQVLLKNAGFKCELGKKFQFGFNSYLIAKKT